MSSKRPCVLMHNTTEENAEWGMRADYVEQFQDYFEIIWTKDVAKNPELGKHVQGAVFNRGNDWGLLEHVDSLYPNLKIIASISVGVERVNVAGYKKKGIRLCNSPGILDEVVADFAIGLIIGSARNIIKGSQYSLRPDITTSFNYEVEQVGGLPVSGASIGIIGLGRIGYHIAKKAFLGFKMKVFYYNKFRRSPEDEKAISATYYTDLHSMLRISDFAVTICPVTPETEGIMGENEFKAMKKSAILINIGRGKLVQTDALTKALQSGEIYGAALDVTDPEPLPRNHPLLKLPNVIITPHIAGSLRERRVKMARMAADNIRAAVEGKPLLSEFKPL